MPKDQYYIIGANSLNLKCIYIGYNEYQNVG